MMSPMYINSAVLNAFADLTEGEKDHLRNLNTGAPHVSTARDGLVEFAQQKGWDDDLLNDVLRLVGTYDS